MYFLNSTSFSYKTIKNVLQLENNNWFLMTKEAFSSRLYRTLHNTLNWTLIQPIMGLTKNILAYTSELH